MAPIQYLASVPGRYQQKKVDQISDPVTNKRLEFVEFLYNLWPVNDFNKTLPSIAAPAWCHILDSNDGGDVTHAVWLHAQA